MDDVSSKAELDGDSVVEAIRDGCAEIHGRRQPLYRSARHYLTGAERKARRALRIRAPSFR